MALIGTISGSNGTKNTAVSGTIVIANQTGAAFPKIPSDAVLFVSGNLDPNSKAVFGGDIVGSGSLLLRNLAGNVVITLANDGNITGSSMLLSNGFVVTGSGIIEANSDLSTPALRVTQQGLGAAIRIEDSTNPDATPFLVTGGGRVGIGTAVPTSYLFITGVDVTIPVMTVRPGDSAVDTFVITSSAAAGGNVGIVTINQGNLANKRALNITNIGGGTSGLRMESSGFGSVAFDNFNASPQLSAANKNLWFNSNGAAYDTTQITYRFTELNKTPTYPNQKTFVITGNTNGFKTGSYFEVEKSGSIKLLELQGDTSDNALFVSGNVNTSGSFSSLFSSGDEGGEIFLSKPATSTTINAGVTIDVYQNKLRIFETSGTNRGGYFDITSLATGVGTDLAFSGSHNAYTTTVGSPFTLAIPATASTIEIEACGGGGGGGSGAKLTPPGNAIYGGGGGSGGNYSYVSLNAATVRAISSNLTITIGVGGLGGAAVTIDSTTGSKGNDGGATTVAAGASTLLYAPGGKGGSGGDSVSGAGGNSSTWKDTGGAGAASAVTAKPATPATAGYAGGGGGGGGLDVGGTERSGGDGGAGGDIRVDNVSRAGGGGTAGGARGGISATTSATYSPTGGGGGGGGAGRNSGGAAGSGGKGIQGSGGGGGGANVNGVGNDSGGGGEGGAGWVIVRFM